MLTKGNSQYSEEFKQDAGNYLGKTFEKASSDLKISKSP